jgi:hypothetical protein
LDVLLEVVGKRAGLGVDGGDDFLLVGCEVRKRDGKAGG